MRVYLAETTEDEWQTLTFEGNADQQLKTQVPEIIDYIIDKTILDIGKVQSMDQDGIHSWLEIIHTMDPEKRVSISNCPSHFIDKVNLIPQLLDNLQLTSLYLPVNCTSCKGQFEILFEDFELLSSEEASEFISKEECSKCNEKNLKPIVDLKIFLGFHTTKKRNPNAKK